MAPPASRYGCRLQSFQPCSHTPLFFSLAPEGGDDDDDDDDDDQAAAAAQMDLGGDDLMEPLPYLFRINTARLLIEMQQLDLANEVLDNLLSEDDEVVQVR